MRFAGQGPFRRTWERLGAYSVWFQSWYLEVQLQVHRGFSLGASLNLWRWGRWGPGLSISLGYIGLHIHKTYENTRWNLKARG
jgi:hypothetical protein